MNEKIASGGAVTSALAYAFCGQLPLILASFGLGSFTMSMWFAQYRWVFLVVSIILLGFAYYKTYSGRKPSSPWSRRILHGTAMLSMGMIVYTLTAT